MQEATKYDLVLCHGTTPITIDKGMVYPPAAGVPVRSNHLHVTVDKITQEWALYIPLPVPGDGVLVLDDARAEIVQWPKNQIILDKVISK